MSEKRYADTDWYNYITVEASKRGFSLTDVCKAIGHAPSYLGWYASTGTIPNREALEGIACCLDIDPHSIPRFDEAKPKAPHKWGGGRKKGCTPACIGCIYRHGNVPCYGDGSNLGMPMTCAFQDTKQRGVTLFERCLLQYYFAEQGDESERHRMFVEEKDPKNIPMYALKCWEKDIMHEYFGSRNPFGIMLNQIWEQGNISAEKGATPKQYQEILEKETMSYRGRGKKRKKKTSQN